MRRYRLVPLALWLTPLPFAVTSSQTAKEPVTCAGHSDKLWAVAFAPDGERLASAGLDGTIRIWNAATGKEHDVLKGPKRLITCLAFSPKSNVLAAGISMKGKPADIEIWDWKKGEILKTLSGHKGAITTLAFSPNGALLATGASDNLLKLWNVDTGKETNSAKGHANTVTSVAFAPDGKSLASGGLDQSIKLWNVADLKETGELKDYPGWVLALSYGADGKTLAAGYGILVKVDVPGKILLWDLAKRKPRATLEGHKDAVTGLAFRKQDQTWASSSMDKTIKLWSDAGKELTTLTGHKEPVLSVALSPDGTRLASASWDKTVKIWNVGK